MKTTSKNIGQIIHELRGTLDCSQEKMGHIIGVSGRTIARWEAGDNGVSPLARYRINELRAILRRLAGVIKENKQTEWLNAPNHEFNDKTPLEIILQGPEGILEVASLLGRLEWGVYS